VRGANCNPAGDVWAVAPQGKDGCPPAVPQPSSRRKNRGLSDIFIAYIDGLSGLPEAVHAAYPQTQVQLCIVHLVRAALRYVSDKDGKSVIRDLKKIYQASIVLEAEAAFAEFSQPGMRNTR
jgi:transposase-like protein